MFTDSGPTDGQGQGLLIYGGAQGMVLLAGPLGETGIAPNPRSRSRTPFHGDDTLWSRGSTPSTLGRDRVITYTVQRKVKRFNVDLTRVEQAGSSRKRRFDGVINNDMLALTGL